LSKRIAVVVRDRQAEALRMAVGLILLDDLIHVYVLDRKVDETEQNSLNIETMQDLDMELYTNIRDNKDMQYLDNRQIAENLLGYDHVLMY